MLGEVLRGVVCTVSPSSRSWDMELGSSCLSPLSHLNLAFKKKKIYIFHLLGNGCFSYMYVCASVIKIGHGTLWN